MKAIRVRNKNAILELLQDNVDFEKIILAENLEQDSLTKEILSVAKSLGVNIEKVPRWEIAKRRDSENREVLVGVLAQNKDWSLRELLADLDEKRQDPFFLLLNRVDYENNIGIIARTAFAAGVNGLIFQGAKEQFFNEETVHFSIGAIARIPLIKMSIFDALHELKKNDIKTFSIQMDGTDYFSEDLSGSIALVLGAERKGLSDGVSKRCDKQIAIPMRKGIDSLNVGMSAAIILYEKVRQEGVNYLSKKA
ncbi:MAG: RNA methyltransferase [Patescibacteria group bacterium]|nr:RNA methyltransferase [Patescibacteria group bacterium]